MQTKKLRLVALAGLLLCGAWSAQAGVAYKGEAYNFRQPNGEVLKVTVDGNDYYAEQRTADGSLVVYDAARKGLCYARVNAAGDDLESTGVLATNARVRPLAMSRPETGLDRAARLRKALQNREQLLGSSTAQHGFGNLSPMTRMSAMAAPVVGSVRGLTVQIQFPDVPATMSYAQIDNFLNALSYNEFGNAQSIRGYYRAVSGGKLDYTNSVSAVYTARHPKSYYTDGSVGFPGRAQELIQEALGWLKSSGYNFSALTTDSNGRILGLNFLYAGEPDSAWSTGLWPHMGGLQQSFCSNGVCAAKYQITNMGQQLAIGTFAHETGHLLFGWPDLYDYDGSSNGSMGAFDIMGVGSVGPQNRYRPVPPNGFFRVQAGWDTVTELNPTLNASAPKGHLTAASGSHAVYRWTNPANPGEAFYFEAIYKADQNTYQPDQGLMVMHIDPAGDNSNEWHPYVQLEPADGQRDMEYRRNNGDTSDLYKGSAYPTFNDITPNASTSRGTNAKWWNNSNSGLAITNISAAAQTMGFDVGAASNGQVTQGYLSDRQTLAQPWFYYSGGTIGVTLSGPGAPVDFDLMLERWNGSAWTRVASSTGPTTSESIRYSAGAGYYRATPYSYSGAGNFTLTLTK